MAGHSKWANIKHRKERQDAKKGKTFTKLIHELIAAAGQDGGIPADSPRLHLVVDKALTASMTRDVINHVIAHGVGSNDADNMVELSYEGYVSDGVATIVEAMIDNRNRTAAGVCHVSNKCGGNLDASGSVTYMSEHKRQISFAPDVDEGALVDAALEAGADDVVVNGDGSIDVFTAFAGSISVNKALAIVGSKSGEVKVTMIPSTTMTLDLETARKILKPIDILEDLGDVQNVYSNADTPNDVMARLG